MVYSHSHCAEQTKPGTLAGRFPMSTNELIEAGEGENGRHVEMSVHQTLRIALSEVRTAGFRWNLRAPDEHVFSLLEDDFAPQASGAGGTLLHHWVFSQRCRATNS